jgi:hypothetical protein
MAARSTSIDVLRSLIDAPVPGDANNVPLVACRRALTDALLGASRPGVTCGA